MNKQSKQKLKKKKEKKSKYTKKEIGLIYYPGLSASKLLSVAWDRRLKLVCYYKLEVIKD